MNGGKISQFLQHLSGVLRAPPGEELTDGQLLEEFLTRHDGAAFEALIRRHGGMVLRVCQRILRNSHDAEDAFQASFLVLIRKGLELRQRQTVANWLYGVAYHTALKARAAAAKRRAKERQASAMASPEARDQESLADIRSLLDQELHRLPARFREPVILCDLEGKTRKEAARSLGCPEGTVASRLSRAHTLLARRLARQGLTLSSAALAAVLAQEAASAAVPASLVQPTVQAGLTLTAGGAVSAGALSAPVAGLVEAVLRGMFLAKLKAVVLVMLAVALIGGLALPLYYLRSQEAGEASPAPARSPETEAILNRAIQAGGGETALGRLHNLAWRGEARIPAHGSHPIVLGGTVHALGDWCIYATVPVREAGADDILMTFKLLFITDAHDPFVGFHKVGGSDARGEELFEAMKKQIRQIVHAPGLREDLSLLRMAQLLAPVRDEGVRLSPTDSVVIDGRPATGIAFVRGDRLAGQLFFDDETGLPSKCVAQVQEKSERPAVTHELYFSNFREVGGARTFTRVACHRAGRPWFVIDLGQLLPQEKVDTRLGSDSVNRYSD